MSITRLKHAAKISIHLGLVFAAFIAAYEVRRGLQIGWWISSPVAKTVVQSGLVYTLIAGGVETIMGTERSSWQYASVREMLRLALACTATAAIFIGLMFFINRAIALPRSTLVLSVTFSLLFLATVRLVWRLFLNPSLAFSDPRSLSAGIPLTLIGEIRQAEAYLRHWYASIDRTYRPVRIVTSDKEWTDQLIHGLPTVVGVEKFIQRLSSNQSPILPEALLFFADPVTELGITSRDIGRLKLAGYRLLRQASPVELMDKSPGALREMKLEEFLPRAPISLDTKSIAALIDGKRVLVTGAGGSIGSELVRQLVRFGCSHITLLDHSEFALFEIDRELATLVDRKAVLCDVRDAVRVSDVIRRARPDIVFHAAALKHVTLVEQNVREGVLTNVIGTRNVAAAATYAGVGHMVMISTDKAVDPSSVMGCTKRIAEAALAGYVGSGTQISVVRFGNVLGSAGSVVPIFRDQIERGGPITITDPQVERYFMTIPEAVQLVLQAVSMRVTDDKHGGLRKFVLEMGEPVKVLDLARQMIELHGSSGMIEIKFIGLRQGEKLTETLIDEGEQSNPCSPGIAEIETVGPQSIMDEGSFNMLADMANSAEEAILSKKLIEMVCEIRNPKIPKYLSIES